MQQGVAALVAVLHDLERRGIVERQFRVLWNGKTANGVEVDRPCAGLCARHCTRFCPWLCVFCPHAGEDIHLLALLSGERQHGLQGFGHAVHLAVGVGKVGNGGVFTASGVTLAPWGHAAQALACEHFVLRKKRIANAVGCQHGVERAHCPHQFEYVEKIPLKHIGQHRIGARKLHVFRYFGHKAGQQSLTLGHALLRQYLVYALCRSQKTGRTGNGPACCLQHVFLHAFF